MKAQASVPFPMRAAVLAIALLLAPLAGCLNGGNEERAARPTATLYGARYPFTPQDALPPAPGGPEAQGARIEDGFEVPPGTRSLLVEVLVVFERSDPIHPELGALQEVALNVSGPDGAVGRDFVTRADASFFWPLEEPPEGAWDVAGRALGTGEVQLTVRAG